MSIDDKLNQLLQIKSDVRNAIIEKGVEVDSSLPLNQYANKIRSISGSIIVQMTQAEYDELAEKDPNTLYVIVG